MDGDGGFEIPVPYTPNIKFFIHFDPEKYNRKPHPNAQIESSIDTIWFEKLSKNPTLFNASKFRLASISNAIDNTCMLHLGLTDYKTYQATHTGHPLKFPLENRAAPLGNVVVIETSDHLFPVLVRSSVSGEGSGACVFPGGHPEPNQIKNSFDDESIINEMWMAAYREVSEELFLQACNLPDIKDMKFLGIVSRRFDQKSSLVFYLKIDTSSKELQTIYKHDNDGVESVQLIFLGMNQMPEVVSCGLVDNKYKAMPEMMGSARLIMQKSESESCKY